MRVELPGRTAAMSRSELSRKTVPQYDASSAMIVTRVRWWDRTWRIGTGDAPVRLDIQ